MQDIDKIIILDFGSQYTQLIARKIRELNIYCEILPYYQDVIFTSHIKGIIFSGSPASVLQPDAPKPAIDLQSLTVPLIGICYGAQWLAQNFGGEVQKSTIREYGRAHLTNIVDSQLFEGVDNGSQVWMSHADSITTLPPNTTLLADTDSIPVAGFKFNDKQWYGIQFHPEVYHSTQGIKLLDNFCTHICGIAADYNPKHFITDSIASIKETVQNDEVIMALSGGVDSSVAAVLIHQAIGNQLKCVFVDNGLLRKNEWGEVLESYKTLGLNIIAIDATHEFYSALAGQSDPEQKRKTIGRVFIETFDKASKEQPNVKWLGQGTIYPDVIESVSVNGPSATIKSHHNVGGLPDSMKLKVLEPLNTLFKDEVRKVGRELGIPSHIVDRHPFPGPGLAIRILGDITADKVKLLQNADHIFIQALKQSGLYKDVWQAGAILLPIHSVGVMGDERTYEQVIALRAVSSTDGMTADWCHLPYSFLADVSNKIINEVKGINRVVYDISSKPPATIEWE